MVKRISIIIGMILFISSAGFAPAEDVAIIVNSKNPTDEVSFEDLVKIFKQEQQYWNGKNKIYLIMQETGTPMKEIVLKKIYKMNDDELKKFWLTKIYREDISVFPKTLGSNEEVKSFVSKAVNAIGFIDARLVDESVKVLCVDGKKPGDTGYPVRE